MTVVDASVVVKWYVPEMHHEPARDLRDDYLEGDHDLTAPRLLPFEVVNALRYSGHYEGDRLREAAESLSRYGLDLVPFEAIPTAVSTVAAELDVTVFDAAYVALADRRETVAYSSDETLIDAADGTRYADRMAHVTAYPV